MEQPEFPSTARWSINLYSSPRILLGSVSLKHSNSIPKYNICTHMFSKEIYKNVYSSTLFNISKVETTQMLLISQINKLWYIHIEQRLTKVFFYKGPDSKYFNFVGNSVCHNSTLSL